MSIKMAKPLREWEPSDEHRHEHRREIETEFDENQMVRFKRWGII
jgi:hypothetical protein